MKKLIPALCMLLVAATLMGTSTYAWFSMNTTVAANGMQVKATSAASLVITDTAGNITTATNVIGMTANNSILTPATHLTSSHKDLNDAAINYLDGDSYLVHVTNTNDVDAVTGLAQDGKTLVYAKSVNGTEIYYIDYTVYIASKGDALSNQDLSATIIPPTGSMKELYNAITVDYWVNDTYVKTDSFADATDAEVIITAGTIPSATAASDNYIKVTMRVYFDGELTNSGKAYVNNGNIDTSAVTFGVSFTTATHS